MSSRTADFRSRLSDAHAAYEAGEYADVVDILSLSVERDPDDLQARRLLAFALDELARGEEAVSHFGVVVDADPTDHESLHRMAVIERVLGRGDDAVGHFERAFAVEPCALYADELARTYVQAGRYDDAISAWRWALSGAGELQDPARARIWAALADVLEDTRDFDGARDALAEAARLLPDDPRLRARLEALGG